MPHLPEVADVAALVRARTRDDLGQELGTFTDATRPTAAEVTTLIANEAGIVTVRTGDVEQLACPNAADIRNAVKQVIAKRVAAIVEQSYRPDDVAQGASAADFYQGSMKDDLEAITLASRECRLWQPGDDPASGGAPNLRPRWSFPPPAYTP